ncbi:hypothetical protein [Kitasatospora sp. NPDC090091]|uniref:hypothetical protein n=1 Tax=Kitasatospora sp. NPDC090091 TaxID=3364081 RepID=UPI00382E71CA
MAPHIANGITRSSFWLRVREFAVPPRVIETATARRRVGDWAGACAAAGVDTDLDLRSVARTHGRELAARIRADLRHLAPDLLRWHLPRIAPDGLLRPGLTVSLARYGTPEPGGPGPLHLVVRTPPAWADGGQRISLGLWDGSRTGAGSRGADAAHHPHLRPDRRFRLDLHRHLWDARRADELRVRSGADRPWADAATADAGRTGPPVPAGPLPPTPLPPGLVPPELRCAVDRWAAEAEILLRAAAADGGHGADGAGSEACRADDAPVTGSVLVRLGTGRRLLLDLATAPDGAGPPELRITAAPTDGSVTTLPVLPDAATWVLPDLDLLRSGRIGPDRLHPLVAAALVPGHVPAGPAAVPDAPGQARIVECRGARHRIGLVDGVLSALDHDPAQLRREELLVALTGTPLPCLRAIDEAHRRPDGLTGVRERLDHGDIAGALAVVEGLLGPAAVLRDGPLRDELEAAAQRRIAYGLFRSGLAGPAPDRRPAPPPCPRGRLSRPRRAAGR